MELCAGRIRLYSACHVFITDGGGAFPGSLFAQFVWPVFGIAAVAGIVAAIATRRFFTPQRRLAITLWAQAAGILAAEIMPGSVVWQSVLFWSAAA